MRLDHLSYAAGPDGLASTAARLGRLLGEPFADGGVHPRFGTRNMVLPLTGGTYLEVVEVLDHPASDKAPFGQAVRSRSNRGGGWMGWVVAVPDISEVEQRLGRSAVDGNRHRPDGHELRWKQIGVLGLQRDPQLPFFVQWQGKAADHPSHGGAGCRIHLDALEIAGDPVRVSQWLGTPVEGLLDDVKVEWVGANTGADGVQGGASGGPEGIVSAHFSTPGGPVRI